MQKKRTIRLLPRNSRDLNLTIEPVSGGLTLFYAFINGIRAIQSDGTKKATWSGKVPNAQIHIKVRVTGINKATFKLGIDLPGTADDQSLTLNLIGGYYETEIIL